MFKDGEQHEHALLDQVFELCKEMADQPSSFPDSIVLSSSSELFLFVNLDAASFLNSIKELFPDIPIRYISQACLGFYAALLDFHASSAKHSLIFLLESPVAYQQYCLNAIGVGFQGLGFNAQEGCAVLRVEKVQSNDLKPGMLAINACRIFSQSKKINGVAELVKKAVRYLSMIQAQIPSKFVTFELFSPWSAQMIKGFDQWLPKEYEPACWLQGCETESKHYLTMKPLIELDQYEDELNNNGLILMTLGAGGRLGVIQVSKFNNTDPIAYLDQEPINNQSYDFHSDLDDCLAIAEQFNMSGDHARLCEHIGKKLNYIQKNSQRHDNEFYSWVVR